MTAVCATCCYYKSDAVAAAMISLSNGVCCYMPPPRPVVKPGDFCSKWKAKP